MDLKFSPCHMDGRLEAVIAGDTLVLNGDPLDFSPLEEGDVLPQQAIDSPWIASDVFRVGGAIQLTLRIPHGQDAPLETRFPVNFNDFKAFGDGILPIPSYD